MKVEVIASGSRTPPRRIVHIIIGPAPVWNGVRYAPQALIPPASTMSLQRTPGWTWRATTHSRVPPPNQSIEASPSPRSSQRQRRPSSAAPHAGRILPYSGSPATPASEISANSSRPRRSRRGVRARGIWGRSYYCDGKTERRKGDVIFAGYACVSRSRGHPQRATAQPEGDHGRAAAAGADRHHRTLRRWQELARLRHPLCRGAAALHRVALHVRQAIPRADAQAAGGRARGDLPGGGDRAEESHDQQPLHGGDSDRDLRLSPAPVGAGRDAVLRHLRERGQVRHGPGGRG